VSKRKIILTGIAAVFIILLGVSVFLIVKKRYLGQAIVNIPEFCLPQAGNGMLFCNTQLTQGKPVVITYFHTDCVYCHTKAQQLQQKTASIEGIQWILVSYAEKDSIVKFIDKYNLNSVSDLYVLSDSLFSLHNSLQVESIPSTYIYNSRHKLVKVMRGSTKIETIVKLAAP